MTKLCPLLILVAGCIVAPPEDTAEEQLRDIEQYNELAAELDARRTEFLGKRVQELAAAGNTLFWLDFTNFSPKLWRYDGSTKLGYTFSIGDGNTYNYRGSSSLVVTAETGTDPVVYHAYDATTPNRLIASTTVAKPSGAKWSAYAVDGSTVYFVDTADGPATLKKWIPGGAMTTVTTLESAGAEVGEFWDFGISGNTMVFIESGRIWSLDVAANRATWLMNKTEVSGTVDFRPDGVLFTQASAGLSFYDYTQKTLVDLKAKIDGNPFKINATFASAAKWYQDFTRWRQYVLYIGQMGLFAYDMKADTITPILLSPNVPDLRVDYRYPVALDTGEMFVTGLTSTSGAVGADGPTYRLDLRTIVQ